MPVFVAFGMLNSNAPNQNAGLFIGQNSITGWDANQKLNIGHGALFGWYNLAFSGLNLTVDNFEFIDGVVNDMDAKISWSMNL